MAAQPALRGHPARERGRIKNRKSLPGSGRPTPVAAAPSCERFLSGPTWAGPELQPFETP